MSLPLEKDGPWLPPYPAPLGMMLGIGPRDAVSKV